MQMNLYVASEKESELKFMGEMKELIIPIYLLASFRKQLKFFKSNHRNKIDVFPSVDIIVKNIYTASLDVRLDNFKP